MTNSDKWWETYGPFVAVAFLLCLFFAFLIIPSVLSWIGSIQERELFLQKQKFEMRVALLEDYRTICTETDVCAPYWDLQKEMKESLK